MTEKVFTRHTSGKYTKTRVPLLDCIPDVLAHPDEVWINDYVKPKDFRNMNFIKFYKEKVINVICDVTDAKNYRIATWFEIYPNAKIADKTKKSRRIDPRWRYRRGLLIKNRGNKVLASVRRLGCATRDVSASPDWMAGARFHFGLIPSGLSYSIFDSRAPSIARCLQFA